jgi:hypothetical protein
MTDQTARFRACSAVSTPTTKQRKTKIMKKTNANPSVSEGRIYLYVCNMSSSKTHMNTVHITNKHPRIAWVLLSLSMLVLRCLNDPIKGDVYLDL